MRDFSKLNTLTNSANILEILQRQVMRSHNKKFLSKLSKYLVEIIRYLILEVPHLCFARI